MISLVDHIGIPAMLEQTAEEANALAFVCLKLARMLRGENPVYNHSTEDLVDNLEEELSDIFVCFEELDKVGVIKMRRMRDWIRWKRRRMVQRLKERSDAY